MKILHINVCGTYNDGWLYQENLMLKQNAADGNETVFITTTKAHLRKDFDEQTYFDDNGVKIYRIKGAKYTPARINTKIRYFPKISKILETEKPDIVYMHGPQTLSVLDVVGYKKRNPKTVLYFDTHADYFNSAKTFFSRNILHKIFYRILIKYAYSYVKKIFYVTLPRKRFFSEVYAVPEDKLEFLPLGGEMFDPREYAEIRNKLRSEMGADENCTVFLHSGKFSRAKKTDFVIKSFLSLKNSNAKLVLAGAVEDDLKISDYNSGNIVNMGWVAPQNLRRLMCACDVFIQPGLHSVLFEQGILAGLAEILLDTEHNRFLMKNGNGILVSRNDEIGGAMQELIDNPEKLKEMKEKALEFAKENLLYSETLKNIFTVVKTDKQQS